MLRGAGWGGPRVPPSCQPSSSSPRVTGDVRAPPAAGESGVWLPSGSIWTCPEAAGNPGKAQNPARAGPGAMAGTTFSRSGLPQQHGQGSFPPHDPPLSRSHGQAGPSYQLPSFTQGPLLPSGSPSRPPQQQPEGAEALAAPARCHRTPGHRPPGPPHAEYMVVTTDNSMCPSTHALCPHQTTEGRGCARPASPARPLVQSSCSLLVCCRN